MRKLVRAFVLLVLLGVVAVAGAWRYFESQANTPIEPEGISKRVEFRVQKGRTLNQLGPELEAAKLIKSATVWKMYVKLHAPPSPKAGRHAVSPGMTVPELLAIFADNPLPDDVP